MFEPLGKARVLRQGSDVTLVALAAMVPRALEAGGGCYFLPTIIDTIDSDARWLELEIFGPVAPIIRFETIDEAITLANATVHELVACRYGGDLAQCLHIAERLHFGMVGINRGLVSDPGAPFDGVKERGIGREGGHVGMLEFLESQYLAVDWCRIWL